MALEKITMLGPFPPTSGGISDYCFELASSLAKKTGVEFLTFKEIYPEFLYPGGAAKENTLDLARHLPEGLSVKPVLSWYNPVGWLKAGLESKGDVFHFQWWTFYLFFPIFAIALISKFRGKKIVCTIHNVLGHESGLIDRFFSSLIFLLPDKFIVHSGQNKAQLQKNFNINESRISVIPMGVFGLYHGKGISKSGARKKLGIPPKAKVVLFFGIIRKYKGLEDLVEAFKISRKTVGNLFLLVAGKPWESEYERSLPKNLGGIENKKLVLEHIPSSQIKFYFSAADLVVLPYREFSAQSAVGSTALSFSKPILASDAGGLPELVLNKGMIFKAGNITEIASKLNQIFLTKGLLQGMALDSKKLGQKYSWKGICERTIGLYNGLFP
ncbi:MAG TPA: glycosyltransferase family 4 protein [archaeon]|nr:glycosyltransferase family 4 protein [archaeon]